MNSKKKKIIKKIVIILLLVFFIGINITYAATTNKISFCQYAGTKRTFKIIGIMINLAKIIVPIIIILTQMVSMVKIITTGKDEDLKESFKTLVKKIIAGLLIFCIPGLLDYTIDELVGYDKSNFIECSNCLLDTNNCDISKEDPVTYTND